MKITNEKLIAMGYKTKSLWTVKTGKQYKQYYICYGGTKQPHKYEHVLIYESEFGPIPKGYIVHHKDGNGINNNIDNLEIMSRAQHQWEHGKKIYIDGELMTLDQVREKFNYSDCANTIHGLTRYIRNGSSRSRLAGHVVQYL